MIEKAIEKIRREMDSKKENSYIQTIGSFLIKQVEINKEAAEKINNEDKTLEKAFKEVEAVARKKAIGGCAVLSDTEVFTIIKKYYGMEAIQDKMLQVEIEEIKEEFNVEEEVKKKSNVVKVDFSTNINDYF